MNTPAYINLLAAWLNLVFFAIWNNPVSLVCAGFSFVLGVVLLADR